MQKLLYRFSIASLVCIYLVIIAGSIVRMTGSGMGCPDWPKCFGYYIPPTDIETLIWSEGRDFEKGNIIILDESLWVANKSFKSGPTFDAKNWELYTKHDYAIFNPVHTWVEYINRLLGALAGIPVLGLFLLSLFYFKRNPKVTIMSFFALVLLLFEAWLGKTVVDGNLIPHQITYHMFGAIGLVAVFVYIIIELSKREFTFKPKRDKGIVLLGLLSLIALSIQVYLGTSVRETVDTIGKTELLAQPEWIEQLGAIFKVHRTFSLLVLGLVGWYAFRVVQSRSVSTWPRVLLVTIVLEVLSGVGMAYLEMPQFLQPLHLFFALVDIGLILFILLDYLKKTEKLAL
jgi:cytochrome c oxidase assembly protein subunit 15